MAKMRGCCESLCPDNEAKMRIREKLLHFYEYKNGQKQVPGILVKAFARSAAGIKTPQSKDLRSESCLKKTVEYLLKDILLDKRKPFQYVYDFIFDRLRAVRQEIVIQTYDARPTIRLLEPMIMFLAFSRYRLCTEPIDNFDSKICDQHLQECLKRVLCCYDEMEKKNDQKNTLRDLQRRGFIEALYQIFNMGAPEALMRGLILPMHIREDPVFELAFGICMDYHRGNLYRVLTKLLKLPHIICGLSTLKLQSIRRRLLEIFSHAFNSKQLTVPVRYLLHLTLIKNEEDVLQQCRTYNIKVSVDRKALHFVKNEFNTGVETIKSTHEPFVEEKLNSIYLPEVLLLMKL